MVGFDTEDVSFVFELTFNYGISQYRRGNDLNCILLHQKDKDGANVEEKLLAALPEAQACKDELGIYKLINDDLVFKFVEGSQATGAQLIAGVELNVTDLDLSCNYYTKLGLQPSPEKKGLFTFKDYDFFYLQLNQVEKIDRAEAYGRIAISCSDADVQRVYDESGSTIINAPITLQTEGKADVVVTILASPDGQEICFVNDSGFRDLSQETKEQVDWERYDKLNAKQQEYRDKFKPQQAQ